MFEDYGSLIDYLNQLISVANTPGFSSFSGILTFLSILIVSGTISHIFTRIVKNRYLGLLVSSVCSIWLYEQVFVKGLSILDILISIIILLALLAIVVLVIFAIFVKKIRVPLKFPLKV